jgi:hypothetical protein
MPKPLQMRAPTWLGNGQARRSCSVYGDASYLSQVSGESRITLKGNVGMRVTW